MRSLEKCSCIFWLFFLIGAKGVWTHLWGRYGKIVADMKFAEVHDFVRFQLSIDTDFTNVHIFPSYTCLTQPMANLQSVEGLLILYRKTKG